MEGFGFGFGLWRLRLKVGGGVTTHTESVTPGEERVP